MRRAPRCGAARTGAPRGARPPAPGHAPAPQAESRATGPTHARRAPALRSAAIRSPRAGCRWSCSSRGRFGQCGELLGLVLGGEGVDDVVEVAIHDVVDLVERQVDAMVGHATLRE